MRTSRLPTYASANAARTKRGVKFSPISLISLLPAAYFIATTALS